MSHFTAEKVSALLAFAAERVDSDPTTMSSAILALNDANATFLRGRFEDSANRAMDSLRHSVGMLSADFAAALDILNRA